MQCFNCAALLPLSSRFCNSCGTAVGDYRPPEPKPLPTLPATFVNGRYRVAKFLGEGGKKKVYLVHDETLDRDVAFALIKTKGLDEVGIERVRREAKVMGRLGDHQHIVTVYDMGDEEGQPFLVTELMGGGDVENDRESEGSPSAPHRRDSHR